MEKLDDGLPESGTALQTTEGVDFQIEVFKPEAVKKMDQHQDKFGIGARIIGTQYLDVDLMELAVAPLLRPLPPEHGTDGKEPGHGFGGMEGVFQVGADDGCRGLRSECEGFLAPVEKGIHLFLHDIGGFTYPAPEKLGLLQEGNTDLAEPEGAKNIVGRLFDMPPLVCLRRKNILETLDGGDDLHQSYLS